MAHLIVHLVQVNALAYASLLWFKWLSHGNQSGALRMVVAMVFSFTALLLISNAIVVDVVYLAAVLSDWNPTS